MMQADHSGIDLPRIDELQRMGAVQRRSEPLSVAQNHGMDVCACEISLLIYKSLSFASLRMNLGVSDGLRLPPSLA